MKDVLNRDIMTGDIVTYPVRRGSQLWTNVGVVVEIIDDTIKAVRIKDEQSRHITLTSPERVTIAVRGCQIVDGLDIATALRV